MFLRVFIYIGLWALGAQLLFLFSHLLISDCTIACGHPTPEQITMSPHCVWYWQVSFCCVVTIAGRTGRYSLHRLSTDAVTDMHCTHVVVHWVVPLGTATRQAPPPDGLPGTCQSCHRHPCHTHCHQSPYLLFMTASTTFWAPSLQKTIYSSFQYTRHPADLHTFCLVKTRAVILSSVLNRIAWNLKHGCLVIVSRTQCHHILQILHNSCSVFFPVFLSGKLFSAKVKQWYWAQFLTKLSETQHIHVW